MFPAGLISLSSYRLRCRSSAACLPAVVPCRLRHPLRTFFISSASPSTPAALPALQQPLPPPPTYLPLLVSRSCPHAKRSAIVGIVAESHSPACKAGARNRPAPDECAVAKGHVRYTHTTIPPACQSQRQWNRQQRLTILPFRCKLRHQLPKRLPLGQASRPRL